MVLNTTKFYSVKLELRHPEDSRRNSGHDEIDRRRSKLVAQSRLDLSGWIQSSGRRSIKCEAGSAQGCVIRGWRSSTVPKYVAVESIGNVELEQYYVVFPNGCFLEDGEVLIHIARTPPVRENCWQVPIYESASVCD